MTRILYLWLAATPALAAQLTLHIDNIRHDGGQILLAVHASEADWRDDKDFSTPVSPPARKLLLKAVPPQVKTTVTDLPPGRYAVAVFHDENGDGKLNRQIYPLLGMPSEPYALSNDAWSWFSMGAFADAAFDLAPGGGEVTLKLKTHLQRIKGAD